MRLLQPEDMVDLAIGAGLLGTGGGGDPYRGRLKAQIAMREHGPVEVLAPDEIGDDDLVIPLWGIGAPGVGIERIDHGDEALQSLRALEDFLGRRAAAVSPIEIGGSNSTVPIRVAAQAGLPVIDCDGMGRAYPEIHMVTATLFGVSVTPASLIDSAGNCLILKTENSERAERIARVVCVQMGGTANMAAYPMTGRQVREVMIPGTLTLAQRTGRCVREARERHTDPIEAFLEQTGGFPLFRGKIIDVDRRIEGGWARGHFDVLGAEETLRIEFQNEFLLARTLEGRTLCMVPDLIICAESQSGEPITTENLRYGHRVAILGVPCDRRWRTPEGITLGGPRHFGLDCDHVPVEELERHSTDHTQ